MKRKIQKKNWKNIEICWKEVENELFENKMLKR